MQYPKVMDPARVGTYPAVVGAGGGYVFDEVLEYRVWSKRRGISMYVAFENFEAAESFSKRAPDATLPLALVLQREYVDEPEPGRQVLKRQRRLTEWQVAWLDESSRRTPENLRRILGDLDVTRAAG
jgi:hypothetical protein